MKIGGLGSRFVLTFLAFAMVPDAAWAAYKDPTAGGDGGRIIRVTTLAKDTPDR